MNALIRCPRPRFHASQNLRWKDTTKCTNLIVPLEKKKSSPFFSLIYLFFFLLPRYLLNVIRVITWKHYFLVIRTSLSRLVIGIKFYLFFFFFFRINYFTRRYIFSFRLVNNHSPPPPLDGLINVSKIFTVVLSTQSLVIFIERRLFEAFIVVSKFYISQGLINHAYCGIIV